MPKATREHDPQAIIALVRDFANAVMEATKKEGKGFRENNREKAIGRTLLRSILLREPFEEELENIIPG